MPAPVLHLGATVLCMHAGTATPAAPFPRVLVSGQQVVTLTSPYVVAGCALTGTGAPPCQPSGAPGWSRPRPAWRP